MTSTERENKGHTTGMEVREENIEHAIESVTPDRKKAVIKASIFVAFVVIAIYVVKFTPIKDYLTAKTLGNFLDSAGLWAPLVFIFVMSGLGLCSVPVELFGLVAPLEEILPPL
jgi:hypothetical protein